MDACMQEGWIEFTHECTQWIYWNLNEWLRFLSSLARHWPCYKYENCQFAQVKHDQLLQLQWEGKGVYIWLKWHKQQGHGHDFKNRSKSTWDWQTYYFIIYHSHQYFSKRTNLLELHKKYMVCLYINYFMSL